jgi:hypothetical protein
MVDVKHRWWIVAAICGLAFWLRTQALGYGLPAVYNMDEVAIMNRALTFGTGTLNPGNFLYPTFYFYVLFAWQGMTFLVGQAMGLWDSLAGFERQFFLDPSALYRSGRLLSALCGVATVIAVDRLATRLFTPMTGLIAALLMAVTPIAVMDAHYVKHDVPVTLLIVLVHVWLARIVTAGTTAHAVSTRRDIWIVGALSGLAMSTHYYAVFVALPVALVLLTQPGVTWQARLQDGVRAGLAATLMFVAASPFLLPELGTAWIDITQNRQIVMDRATDAGAFPSLWTYLTMLKTDRSFVILAFGTIFVLIAGGSTRNKVVALVFPAAFLLFISNTVPATRYLNPILPFVAVAGGVFGGTIVSSFTNRWRWFWRGLFLVALTVPGLTASVNVGQFFRQTDTRTLAQQWIETNVPAGSTVVVQPYSVPLRQSREGLVEALRVHLGDEASASVKFQKQLALSPYPTPAYRTIFLGDGGLDADKIYVSPRTFEEATVLNPLEALGVQWVVVKRYNVNNPSLAAFDRTLAREGRLMQTFSPYDPAADEAARSTVAPFEHNADARLDRALVRPGPVVEIWRIQ